MREIKALISWILVLALGIWASPQYALRFEGQMESALRSDVITDMLHDLTTSLSKVDSQDSTLRIWGQTVSSIQGNNEDGFSIRKDAYWAAFFHSVPADPRVLWSRAALLGSQGLWQRASYVMTFAHLQSKVIVDSNLEKTINDIQERMDLLAFRSNEHVENGLILLDSGNVERARDQYQVALAMYPKNPWATYELGATYLLDGLSKMRDSVAYLQTPSQQYFAKVRTYDPWYGVAYQGSKGLTQNATVVSEQIQPNWDRIKIGKGDADYYQQFAMGCELIGEYEFALYGYALALQEKLDAERMADIRTHMKQCLQQLGVTIKI